jgi:hypothetical protein
MRTVVRIEFGQDAVDMDLEGSFRDRERRPDLGVVLAAR